MEWNFVVPNYSCLQNPWLGGYCPQTHVLPVLCPQLNLLNSLPRNKIPRYATGKQDSEHAGNEEVLNEISCTILHPPPEPLTRGLLPPYPRSLCPQPNLLNSLPRNKIPRYATGEQDSEQAGNEEVLHENSCTKLQPPPESLTRGLMPQDPRSLFPLSLTEFVDPLHEQNSRLRHWRTGQWTRRKWGSVTTLASLPNTADFYILIT